MSNYKRWGNEPGQCIASMEIEDECSVMQYRCTKAEGHEGPHETNYPGQWGEVSEPVAWSDPEPHRMEFYRNVVVADKSSDPNRNTPPEGE